MSDTYRIDKRLTNSRVKRTLSWLFGVLAYFGPPVWAAFALEADRKSQLASTPIKSITWSFLQKS
jgi:hypothetical protein